MNAVPTAVNQVLGARPPVVPFPFDFKNPDYTSVFQFRWERLKKIRKDKSADRLKVFYRANPVQFVIDWGVTYEPRNIEIGLPARIPFIPFPKQIEWMLWVLSRWRSRERGLTEKSRGAGMSWGAISLACTLCLFNRDMSIGFGSRKAEYVDQLGDPKSLFWKARAFLNNLPEEFRFGWRESADAREMRIMFPGTESVMTGEAGISIGRGDRTSIYFVDEAAFLQDQESVEGSLSETTNCRIDISTPNGSLNAFYDRRMALPEHQVFSYPVESDPRKDAEWKAKKLREIPLAVYDREYGLRYDEGGSFFAEQSLLVPVFGPDDAPILKPDGSQLYEPVDWPEKIDFVFAIIDTATKTGQEHDGLAVTYFAYCSTGIAAPLTVLDWDYKQIEGAFLEEWLPTVFRTLEEFARSCKARMGSYGAKIEDKSSGMVLIQQAINNGWPAEAIDSKLTAMGKVERSIDVSGHVHQGKVKVTRQAYERTVDFKGVTKNHFLAQVLGFRAANIDKVPDDCLDTFTYGVALSLGNSDGF